MYTIKNESGNFLKYVFKDNIIFNGEKNARSIVVYKCKKLSSAEKLKERCEAFGHKNLEVVEITDDDINNIPKPTAPTKESSVKYIEPYLTEEEIYCDEEDPNFDDEYLFKELNKKCLGCSRLCKQSAKATIVRCPQYSPKG